MGPPIIPEETLRTAFRRRAAGDKLTDIARDLGIQDGHLIRVLRGFYRPNLFLELGFLLPPVYFTPTHLAEAKARQARKKALLLLEEEKGRKWEKSREQKRAASAARRKERQTERKAKRPRFVPLPRTIPVEKRLFDGESIANLILDWQETGNPILFEQIIAASLKLIRFAVSRYRFLTQEDSEVDELVNEVVLELNRVLPGFNPHLGGGVFTFFSLTVRYHLLHRRSKLVKLGKRLELVSPELLEEKGGFYQSPDLPNEFRERLTRFTTQFAIPEELIAARYMINCLLEEERIPSARQIRRATDIGLTDKRTRELAAHLLRRLRSTFAEDWQLQRFGAFVALCGVRLRVEVWLICA